MSSRVRSRAIEKQIRQNQTTHKPHDTHTFASYQRGLALRRMKHRIDVEGNGCECLLEVLRRRVNHLELYLALGWFRNVDQQRVEGFALLRFVFRGWLF